MHEEHWLYTHVIGVFLQSYAFPQPRNHLNTWAANLFQKFAGFNICHLHIAVKWQKEAKIRARNMVMEPPLLSLKGFLLYIV